MQIKCKRKLVSVDGKGTMNFVLFHHPKDRIFVNIVATMSIAVKFISLISTMPPYPPSECVTWTRPHSIGPKTMEQLSTSASTLLALKNCFLIPGLGLMNYQIICLLLLQIISFKYSLSVSNVHLMNCKSPTAVLFPIIQKTACAMSTAVC